MSIISTFLFQLASPLLSVVYFSPSGAAIAVVAAVKLHVFEPTFFGGGHVTTGRTIRGHLCNSG
ncbi:hypothetical protein BS50DRAFT_580111 [Corynespora cassiicola Philippines]|uniref:Uncharacterized protein n=1 Tax=Corynespora cassiicola Philippines TaxID=1448308 RepID=A0A2T2N1C1_CORCC|nr:hypothetical protein BS50DRAFT_580111 [Corynespora cassiicola Philippines]